MNKVRSLKKTECASGVLLATLLCCGPVVADQVTKNDSQTTNSDSSQSDKNLNDTDKLQLKPIVVEVTAESKVPYRFQEDKYNDELQGFRPKRVDLGPLGTKSLQDTPYSVDVIGGDILEDQAIDSLNDALKYLSSTQMEARGGTDVGRPQSRGMEGSVVDNNHLDGLNVVATTAQPMETLERVEVINGLTGSLYGPASPAGDFNYILKRPTRDYYNAVTTGYSTDGGWTVHTDLGGTPNPYFGYRINALSSNGDGYVSGSNKNRRLLSGAFDVHLSDQTTLELNTIHYRLKRYGYPGGFSYSDALPDALDPLKTGYGQSFSGMDLQTDTYSAKLIHEFDNGWKLNAGMLRQTARRQLNGSSNTISADGSTLTQKYSDAQAASRFAITSDMLNLTGQVHTGAISHDLVMGTTGYTWDIFNATNRRSSTTLGTSPISDPQTYSYPGRSTGRVYHSGETEVRTESLGDTITWNHYFSIMLVGAYSRFDSESYSSSGTKSADYTDGGYSTTVSFMYKPVDRVTTYIAHADTLESGGTAGSTANNAGETLSPVRSKQNELGVKADMGGFDLHAALFDIKRPLAYTGSDGDYRVQGLQRNRGVEVGISGQVLPQLKIYSGITYLDAKLEDAYEADAEGKDVVGVPDYQANLLADYTVAQVPGLSLNMNIHYTGERAANSTNTISVDPYTTLDLGAKYVIPSVYGKKVTVRLNMDNVTNKKYWAAIFPGNIYGNTGSSNTAFLGDPRTITLSTTVEF